MFPWLPSKTLCSLRVGTMSVTSLHVFPPPEGGFTGKGSPASCACYFSASGDVVSREPDMCYVPQEDAPFCMCENQSSDLPLTQGYESISQLMYLTPKFSVSKSSVSYGGAEVDKLVWSKRADFRLGTWKAAHPTGPGWREASPGAHL